jgi:acyl-CoA synthetase (AMP-forming)/AMP-acid ligase II
VGCADAGALLRPPIVGYQGRFSAERAFELLERYGVTNTFLFPTALKQMMKACPRRGALPLKLRAIMSAGEAVGETVFTWCRDALGVIVNEMFGQTEINYIVGNCTAQNDDAAWLARAARIDGPPLPGHRVAVIDEDGRPCAPGEDGEVAVCATDIHGHPDPVFFLGYWKNEAATAAKYRNTTACAGAAPATWRASTPTATSGTRAAPTTCSSHRATASGRARSRTACSSIRPCRTAPWCRRRTPSAGHRQGVHRADAVGARVRSITTRR